MSLLSRVIGFVAGEAICGSGSGSGSSGDDASFTGITSVTGGRAKATSETGIQVGVSTSKAERQEQRRNQRLTSGIQRLRATVAAQAKASSSISRLTSEAEDYHIGKTISKLLKPEKKTGDLTDCGKIVVEVEGEPEHRIVVRDVGRGNFEVCEVITVEARTEDLAYLLAGVRLGRINDPVRRSDISRRVSRIQKALGRRDSDGPAAT